MTETQNKDTINAEKDRVIADRFKFRAWDKEEETYCYDAEETYDFICGNSTVAVETFCNLLISERYVVEQCTGLKDKNGKLIYEGDVVQVCTHDGLFAAVIKYEHCSWMAVFPKSIYRLPLLCIETKIEVSGNIHENPELLEGNNA